MAAVLKTFKYLLQHKDYCLAAPISEGDIDITDKLNDLTLVPANNFRFYTDTDHAGNREEQNKRRSQNGLMVTNRGAPVHWYSKATSECYASSDIGEAHADTSSAAVEIYGAGNATLELMGFSYMVEEMGIYFPKPFILEMDNDAALIFAEGGALKTKLKHIDCRQEWVIKLRDRSIIIPAHVSTLDNLADLFTKILPKDRFQELRDQCMRVLSIQSERAKKNESI